MTVDETGEALARLDAAGLSLRDLSTADPRQDIIPISRAGDRRYLLGQMKKRRFVELFNRFWLEGRTDALQAALDEIGWSRGYYSKVRASNRKFAAQIDAIRGGSKGRPSAKKLAGARKQAETRQLVKQLEQEWAAPADEPTLVIPLPDPTEGEANWQGFSGFRREFFGMHTAWYQQLIIDTLETSKPGSITLILLPPEHGKTSTLEDWIGYKLALEPDYRIVYASERQAHGRKVIKRVKNRMHPEGPCRDYVRRFGPFGPQNGEEAHPQPWGQDYFDVWRRADSDERDYNCVALGFGSAVAGTRCDLLVLDDVQSLKSINLTEQIVEQFRQDWLSRPGSKGRTVILGTRVGERDFYEAIMDAGLVDHLVKIPAVEPSTGQYLWPERYTPEDYDRMRRNAGEAAWARNYQQQPTAAGERTFDQALLTEASDQLLRVGINPDHIPVRSVIVGHDPGFGTNAVFVAGVTEDKFVALDWRTDRGLTSTAQMAQVLEDVMDAWTRQGVRVAHLVVEDKYVGQGLKNDEAFLDLTRKYGCSLSGHKTSLSKIDDDLGVAAMARSFRVGEVVLPGADDPDTQRQRAALDAELHAWRPMVRGAKLRQDLVMAMWFCWMRWRTERLNASTDDRSHLIRTSGLGGIRPVKFFPVVNPTGPLVGAR